MISALISTKIITGTVKFFDVKKGFGFIKGIDGYEAYVHYSDIQRADSKLDAGDKVEYRIEQGAKGWRARDVTIMRSR